MTYSLIVTVSGDVIEIAESGRLDLILVLARGIAQCPGEDVEAVSVWRTDDNGLYAGDEFSWTR